MESPSSESRHGQQMPCNLGNCRGLFHCGDRRLLSTDYMILYYSYKIGIRSLCGTQNYAGGVRSIYRKCFVLIPRFHVDLFMDNMPPLSPSKVVSLSPTVVRLLGPHLLLSIFAGFMATVSEHAVPGEGQRHLALILRHNTI